MKTWDYILYVFRFAFEAKKNTMDGTCGKRTLTTTIEDYH